MRAGALYAYTRHSAEMVCIGLETEFMKAVAETELNWPEWSFPESHPPGLLLPLP